MERDGRHEASDESVTSECFRQNVDADRESESDSETLLDGESIFA